LHNWGKEKFGNIPKKIKAAQNELQHLNSQNHSGDLMESIKNKEHEIDNLLYQEEMWWSQMSRVLWLKHGDRNTSFFIVRPHTEETRTELRLSQIPRELLTLNLIKLKKLSSLTFKTCSEAKTLTISLKLSVWWLMSSLKTCLISFRKSLPRKK
jgi:hypothetical protein